MPFEGRKINTKQALALCYEAGFRGRGLTKAVCVMNAESARYTRAYYTNPSYSVDRGLFQINSVHANDPIFTSDTSYATIPEAIFDVRNNVAYAFKLSKGGTDWSPWMAYKSGKWRVFLPTVLAVKAAGLWWELVGSPILDRL